MSAPDHTVYLIDADPAVRDALGLMLGVRGYRAALFGSAEDFVTAWRAEWSGCVVLDAGLPGMDGMSLQQRLKEMGCDLPVIVIGGDASFHAAREAFRANAVDYIEKPLDQERMIAAIGEAFSRAEVLRGHRQRHEEALARLRDLARSERELIGLGMGHAEAAAPGVAQMAVASGASGTLPRSSLADVVVFEPQPLMRVGLAAMLRGMGIESTALADSLRQGLPLLQTAPRLVIADLDLTDSTGLATLQAIRRAAPDTPVMLTGRDMPLDLARECFAAGARGFIDKDTAPALMTRAIDVVLRGGQFLPETLALHLAGQPAPMAQERQEVGSATSNPSRAAPVTAAPAATSQAEGSAPAVDCSRITGRQRDVARLIAAGLSNKEIARELNISLGTAKNYVAQILSILGAKSRSRAATLMLTHHAAGAGAPRSDEYSAANGGRLQ